jgi:glutamyl-tRNA synthetase
MTVVTRFAPSPTGHLHVGGARTALYSWALARRLGGRFILRIEDTDRERSDPEMTRGILDSMTWLGLHWDEGPVFQSERKELYRAAADDLLARGAAYRCFCTPARIDELRRRQATDGATEGYDRFCRGLDPAEGARRAAAGEAHVLRFAMPLEGETVFRDELRGAISYPDRQQDDFVLIKSDGFPTYHLANVIDDHAMAVTHVLRGEEWIPSTPKHVRLYEAFGWTPPAFAHLPVILAPDGKKLSKRHGATSVEEYRARGFLPEALANYLALLGWSPGDDREIFTPEEMTSLFELGRVNKRSAIFDEVKLRWMNSRYLAAIPWDRLEPLLAPCLVGLDPTAETLERWGVSLAPAAWRRAVLLLGQERAETVPECLEKVRFLFEEGIEFDPESCEKHWKIEDAAAKIRTGREAIVAAEPWTPEAIEAAIRGAADAKGFKHGKLFHPLRVAVTGRQHSPGLFQTIFLTGRARSIERIDRALERIASSS